MKTSGHPGQPVGHRSFDYVLVEERLGDVFELPDLHSPAVRGQAVLIDELLVSAALDDLFGAGYSANESFTFTSLVCEPSAMDIEEFFETMPFADLLGVEVTEAEDGHASGMIEMRPELSWHSERLMAHGGVTFTLADTVGGAALVSMVDQPVPTIDMRIDYLKAGTGDLYAEADVVRCGSDVGVVDVLVTDEDGTALADARGVYKTG